MYGIMYGIISFDNIIVIYPFLALFFVILPTISYTYPSHTKSVMISVSYDMTHWYDIRAYKP